MRIHSFRLYVLTGLLLLPWAVPGTAGETSEKKTPDALPGVEKDYSIVTPAPEPLQAPASDDGFVKVGDWELRISGSIMYQIEASSAHSNKR